MKFGNYVFIGIVVLVVVLGVLIGNGLFRGQQDIDDPSRERILQTAGVDAAQDFKTVLTGTTDSGSVSIALTPLGVIDGLFSVKIAANTHSVSLGQFDLQEITTLEVHGKKIKPVSAPALGGHHVRGTIDFNIQEPMTDFTIKIMGIPNIDERVFEWGSK